ncbi:MAG: four helix bundle protein [candidate division WOR-3 bacterium]
MDKNRLVSNYTELDVYKLAKDGAMKIFYLTKNFPPEERYSLTDQIRRSSRSVCANICEAWHKRRYRLAFISKLSDAETEAAETKEWLDFALRCNYIDDSTFKPLSYLYTNIIGKLIRMIDNPSPWLIIGKKSN